MSAKTLGAAVSSTLPLCTYMLSATTPRSAGQLIAGRKRLRRNSSIVIVNDMASVEAASI